MTDQTTTGGAPPDEYLQAEVQRLLTEHPEVAEQGITANLRGHALVLCGEVESTQRREEILRLVMTRFPDVPIQMDVGLVRAQAPTEVEDLR
jgi:hypothetical protein